MGNQEGDQAYEGSPGWGGGRIPELLELERRGHV